MVGQRGWWVLRLSHMRDLHTPMPVTAVLVDFTHSRQEWTYVDSIGGPPPDRLHSARSFSFPLAELAHNGSAALVTGTMAGNAIILYILSTLQYLLILLLPLMRSPLM